MNYLDAPWQGFYDVFKIINEDLMIGRVYLGTYPNGTRVFTFPMSRVYGFAQMTVNDHNALYAQGAVPTPHDVEGVWRMDCISNANTRRRRGLSAVQQSSGRPFCGAISAHGLDGRTGDAVVPEGPLPTNRLTPLHDEIRKVSGDFLVGKYVTQLPPADRRHDRQFHARSLP
ncbi:MAG: hypothetical protein WDO73_17930 [Ignavibacteriota bacterium]